MGLRKRSATLSVAVAASSLIALLAAIALARFRFRLRTSYLIFLGTDTAAGRFTWGFAPWAAVRRIDPAAGDGAAAGAILAEFAGRPLVVAVRDALAALPLLGDLLAARPDAVVAEMGLPAWTPPPGTAYLVTHGASRACAQAAAEALGLA